MSPRKGDAMAFVKKNTTLQAKIVAVGPVKVLASHGLGILKQAVSNRTTKEAYSLGEISRTGEGEVDLAAEIKKHPEALWLRVKAIEADNENDNGDYFSREEILKAYKTFEGVPVFTNHENSKVENAKGKVVLAEWNDEEGSVYCTLFVDREANPALCRAIEEGYVTDVSMGTQVDYSVCSICGQKATVAEDYCSHVKTMKGRKIDGKKVYEENYGLKFIEISVVTDGACKDCTIRQVLDPEEFMGAAQQLAVAAKSFREVKTGQLYKDSGQQEVELLNGAMDNIEKVLRAMLDQRAYIDLEFMNNLTEVFAELQHVTDELVDQGYGSVSTTGVAPQPIPEIGKEQQPATANEATTSPVATGVGTITQPTASGKEENVKLSAKERLQNRLEDLHNITQKIYEGLDRGDNHVNKSENYKKTIEKLAAVWENPSVKNFTTEVSEGEYRIVVGKEEILGMRGSEKLASLKVAELDADIQEALKEDVYKTASYMLDAFRQRNMQKNAEAATSDREQQWGETMEKQLDREKLELHPRQDDPRQSITEDQLQEKGTPGYESSPHKQGMEDGGRHEITEKQMGGKYEGFDYHKPQNEPRAEIHERQLRNEKWQGNVTPATSDRAWAAGVEDQKQQITEAQLRDWLAADDGHNPLHEITEKQLREQGDPIGRIATAKAAVQRVKEAIRRTAKITGAGAMEILSVIPNLRNKSEEVAKLADSAETRKVALKRALASGPVRPDLDVEHYLLGNIADQKVETKLAFEAMEALANDGEEGIKKILSVAPKCKSCEAKEISVKDILKEALAEEPVTKDEQVEDVSVVMALSEINADPKSEAFAKAAFAAARKHAEVNGVEITEEVQVQVAPQGDANKVAVLMRGTQGTKKEAKQEETKQEAPKAEEPKADKLAERAKARRDVVAQFGGEGGMGGTTMPAQPPMAPGAGGTPAAGAPPMGPDAGIGALGQEPPAGPDDASDENAESMPPGSICPSCGKDDVDLKGGEWDCNNCGANGTMEVNIRVKNWPDTIQESGPSESKGEDLELEEGIGEMEGGEGMEMPQIGMASVFKITPEMVKVAKGLPLGSFCPHCGSDKVKINKKAGKFSGHCQKCSNAYVAEVFCDTETNDLVGRIAWKDKNIEKLAKAQVSVKGQRKMAAKISGKTLSERKAALNLALKAKGWTEKFAKADIDGKTVIIGELAEAGLIPKK